MSGEAGWLGGGSVGFVTTGSVGRGLGFEIYCVLLFRKDEESQSAL
jgi:hypothetical protein